MKTGSSIACNLGAVDEAQRERRAKLGARLQRSVREIVPSADGYTLSWREAAQAETVYRDVSQTQLTGANRGNGVVPDLRYLCYLLLETLCFVEQIRHC